MSTPVSSSPSAPDWEPPSPEELGRLLPQYEITEILGRGGMGAVYKGRQANLDRGVAIKLLSSAVTQGEDELNFVARFKQEAQAMGKLDHPAIISVHDFGETSDGQLYLVMEFIDGMDIDQYLHHEGGKLSQEHALSITAHVLDALNYAHDNGIIHRDIKPANVLLNHDGRVKIADFGLAKKIGDAVDESTPALTVTSGTLGTPDFVAPEALIVGKLVDHRADLYAVGVMLYQMLTGELPRGRFQLPSELDSTLDSRLDGVVDKAMKTDPEHRYSSAAEMRIDLDKILSEPISRFVTGAAAEKKLATVKTSQLAESVVAKKMPKPAVKEASNMKFYVGIGLAAAIIIGGLIVIMGKKGGDSRETTTAASRGSSPESTQRAKSGSSNAREVSSNNEKLPPKPQVQTPPKVLTTKPPAKVDGKGKSVDLLPLVDLKLTPEHQLKNGALHVATGIQVLVEYPVAEEVEDGYVFDAVISGTQTHGFIFHLPIGDRRVRIGVDMGVKPDNNKSYIAIDEYKVKSGEDSSSMITYPTDQIKISGGSSHRLTATVSKSQIAIDIDGKRQVEWKGNSIDLPKDWAKPVKDRASGGMPVLNFYGTYVIHQLRLLPLGSEVELNLTEISKPVSPPKKSSEEVKKVEAKVNSGVMPEAQKSPDISAIPGVKTRLEGYFAARRTQVGGLAAKYGSAIGSRLNNAADAGDLKLATAFRAEETQLKKLMEALTTPPKDLVGAVQGGVTLEDLPDSSPDGMVKLRETWTTERQKIRASLAIALEKSLKSLETELTKKRDFDNAHKVFAYRESISNPGFATVVSIVEPKEPKPTLPQIGDPMAIVSGTKKQPFENSLGMRFVPVRITGGPSNGEKVFFSIWETRVKDYEQFIKDDNRKWPKAVFEQDDDHPAVQASWHDAVAFCAWLTKRERRKGKLDENKVYRLPTDHEWSCAMGIGKEEDADTAPNLKDGKILKVYFWGDKFPPGKGAGNYKGQEAKADPTGKQLRIESYNDGYEWTAPVGSFDANEFGLYDMGGNLWEWCDDWFDPVKKERRLLRGACWTSNTWASLLVSNRGAGGPDNHNNAFGFRVVIGNIAGAEVSKTTPDSPAPSGNTTSGVLSSATKDKPFKNSLGMRFVPVPIREGPSHRKPVLFSIWETRVSDFEEYLDDHDRKAPNAGFPQEDDHPAVTVKWDDAVAFCKWLTEKERKRGKIGEDDAYRLPSDHEWSCAVGIGKDEDAEAAPVRKIKKLAGVYPWGEKWPPPKPTGNYYGEETKGNPVSNSDKKQINGYDDGFTRTAPVGSFEANEYGLYDLGGNVREWCDDWFDPAVKTRRVIRGGSWIAFGDELLSSFRLASKPANAFGAQGFRVVLARQTDD